jgi:hypothetical protein
VTSFSNIALPPDLDDILDLDASMEGNSSTIDSCLQGRKREQQCIEEQWQMEEERANMGVFTDAEDSTCAGTFVDPAATPNRDGTQ